MYQMTHEEKLLVYHEGLRLKPYTCTAGKLTIGIGRNLEDNGISEKEALYMLRNDLARCQSELSSFRFPGLNFARMLALRNMLFNIGLTRFSTFKKMIKALHLGEYEIAANEMLGSKWARQVGDRATCLAEIIRTGEVDEKHLK